MTLSRFNLLFSVVPFFTFLSSSHIIRFWFSLWFFLSTPPSNAHSCMQNIIQNKPKITSSWYEFSCIPLLLRSWVWRSIGEKLSFCCFALLVPSLIPRSMKRDADHTTCESRRRAERFQFAANDLEEVRSAFHLRLQLHARCAGSYC